MYTINIKNSRNIGIPPQKYDKDAGDSGSRQFLLFFIDLKSCTI